MSNKIKCLYCGRDVNEIQEYIDLAKIEGYLLVEECVKREEGTYNGNGGCCCTDCYISLGQPSLPGMKGWKAGDPLDGGYVQ